jgi:hypothetical protein
MKMGMAANACAMADKGFLPDAGGSLDQSEWFINCYRLMCNELTQIEIADAEAASAKAKM